MLTVKSNSSFMVNDVEFKDFTQLNQDEAKIVLEMRNFPQVRAQMFSDGIISEENHFQFLNKLKENHTSKYWLVSKNQQILGVGYLTDIDLKKKQSFFGVYANLINHYPGSGTIIAQSILDYGFTNLKLTSIQIEVIGSNQIALNYYKKLGFVTKEILVKKLFRDGKWLDIVLMIIDQKSLQKTVSG